MNSFNHLIESHWFCGWCSLTVLAFIYSVKKLWQNLFRKYFLASKLLCYVWSWDVEMDAILQTSNGNTHAFSFCMCGNMHVNTSTFSPLQTRKYVQSFIKPGMTMIDIW